MNSNNSNEKRFDIYCLDTIMLGFMGIDVAKEIGAVSTKPRRFYSSAVAAEFCCLSPRYAPPSGPLTGADLQGHIEEIRLPFQYK